MTNPTLTIDVLFTPLEVDAYLAHGQQDRAASRKLFIVLDILRASTTILTALDIGAWGVYPVESIDEALSLRQQNPEWLLAGEVEGIKPEGFDFGNSPVEIETHRGELLRKRLILATSNGTRLIRKLAPTLAVNDRLYVGALTNLETLAHQIKDDLSDVQQNTNIIFCCAARQGRASLEDTFVAGWMAAYLSFILEPVIPVLSDSAHIAIRSYKTYGEDPMVAFMDSHHGQRLMSMEMHRDVEYCTFLNHSPLVAVYEQGWIVPAN
ncbi:MAG: 2-phosphosulfolactate phosphatase [Cyanobacteria bacterium]|nr:2-phosphosulfolactate phosphatase [Cyanobacteriota bacterium]